MGRPALPEPRHPGAPGQRYRILFVCTGNICRSPMAAMATRALAGDATGEGGASLGALLEVDSAGTGPWHEGEPMDARAAAALRRAGLCDMGHVAHQASPRELPDYDLVVALDRRHQQTLRSLGADPERLLLLRALDPAAGAAADVPDPYYGDDAEFDACLAMIVRGCQGLVEGLRTLLVPVARA
jgi:protein-tyrosine phosphatase